MIKGIYSSDRYVQINNGQPHTPSIYNGHSNNSSGAQSFAGQIRYNTVNQGIEVFDGNMWQMLGHSVAQIGLSPEAEALLGWVKQKMLEEAELKTRMERHPGLKDAWEKFRVMDTLTAEQEKNRDFGEVQTSP